MSEVVFVVKAGLDVLDVYLDGAVAREHADRIGGRVEERDL